MLTLVVNKINFNEILYDINKDFWPLSIARPELRKTIRSTMRSLIVFFIWFSVITFCAASQIVSISIVLGLETLPLPSTFPFTQNRVLIYEMLYLWQAFMQYTAGFLVIGFDCFFASILATTTAQFEILEDVLKRVYDYRNLDEKRQLYGMLDISGDFKENQLLLKCVKHHAKLMELCDKIENAFSNMVLMQLGITCLSLCVSSLVLTSDNNALKGNMLSYALAHTTEFLIYCALGNELIIKSQNIGNAAFHCGWHAVPLEKSTKFALIMMIQRSQREAKVTAAGFTELNYRSFVMIARLTFSFYTMLSTYQGK